MLGTLFDFEIGAFLEIQRYVIPLALRILTSK